MGKCKSLQIQISPTTGDKIPLDLLTDILARLPVKSLLRFRSLSKPWLSRFSSPKFIDSHLCRGLERNESLLLNIDAESVSIIRLNSCEIVAAVIPPSPRKKHWIPDLILVGSCNGIVCAAVIFDKTDVGIFGENERPDKYNFRKICLWNPATKHYKLIPPHKIVTNQMVASFGFGFDPIANDFKVVRIFKTIVDVGFFADVYSVNKNVWRRVQPPPTDFPDGMTFDVCVRGLLCCKGYDGLMVFDLNKDVFKCGIKFPPDSAIKFPPGRHHDLCITEFKDSVAVIDYAKVGEASSEIKLWTLEYACLRGEKEESWTLMFSLDVALAVDMVYDCFNSGDLLLHADGQAEVCFLYNPDNKDYKAVRIPRILCRMFKYTESLVSVRGSKQVRCNAANSDDSFRTQQIFWYSAYD